ncbi:MAG: nucleoside kinase [Kiritimatiellae bacterium]|nr:nucleoside kinase [Kiritimatiellia bacterium]NLD89678.1 nucleoside kinase [Lentisphaerota bacterium]HOU21104.1 nucleoside kinase [Kiritimatiellia bacterium]HPC19286.1 nucleoside kinase [Kiritimatiellia bacterium]HQN79543.1 nucleoside kinase [Kiritimatiellia bacterium]
MASRMVKVKFAHGPELQVEAGIALSQIFQRHPAVMQGIDFPPLAALVNNEYVSVEYRIETDSQVRILGYRDSYGQRVYRHTVAFLLAKVAHELYPGCDFAVEHSLSKGLYCSFRLGEEPGITSEQLANLEGGLRRLFAEQAPIDRIKITYDEAIAHFEAAQATDKLNLLRYKNSSKVSVYRCGAYMDLAHQPLASNAGALGNCQLIAYQQGFVMMGPDRMDPTRFPPFDPAHYIYDVFKGHKDWGRIVRVRTVGDLNERIAKKKIDDFIDVNEAYQEKRIALLAEQIVQRRGQVKWILIAGPSSSGKTTFSKRLSLQLKASGMNAKPVSLDNYFVGRAQTPKDENGEPDFEHIETLDLKLVHDQLARLDAGERLELPYFNFNTGAREWRGDMMHIGPDDVVVLEGIHGLNPRLTATIPAEHKFRIYISALTQLNIDSNNRISTTDNRLIRRMVRDNNFRSHGALQTLAMWPKVRRGEKTWIFPYQKEADVAFNSALDYELAVLRPFAEPLLAEIKPSMPQYAEAMRLQQFLSHFLVIPPDRVPPTSVIREFIGQSFFQY